MMARGTGGHERIRHRTGQHGIHRRDRATNRTARGSNRPRGHMRIGIELPPTRLRLCRHDAIDIGLRMTALDYIILCQRCLFPDQILKPIL